MTRVAECAAPAFKIAAGQLASGVCVITHGVGAQCIRLTATSVMPLSSAPPTLIVCINRSTSLFRQLAAGDLFGVNVLAAQHVEIAERFAERKGVERPDRFAAGRWTPTPDGVMMLEDALAAFLCEVEEVIERHTHAILIGRVRSARPNERGGALLHWRGDYDRMGWTDEELSRAVGLRQPSKAAGRMSQNPEPPSGGIRT